jgi:hypothetical protein
MNHLANETIKGDENYLQKLFRNNTHKMLYLGHRPFIGHKLGAIS